MSDTDTHDPGFEALSKASRNSFRILIAILVLASVFFLWKSVFIVRQDEVGIILRFGKPVLSDGKNYHTKGTYLTLPFPIDEKIKLPESTKTQQLTSLAYWY